MQRHNRLVTLWIVLLSALCIAVEGFEQFDARSLRSRWVTPITLEHATTTQQTAWGLMRRSSLPENHGMTFNFSQPEHKRFWMFNCFIDLSIAYLNDNKMICETHELKAHPEWMKNHPPVKTIWDLGNLPINDSIAQRFTAAGIDSSFPLQFAIEMNKNWFKQNDVQPGDIALWRTDRRKGYILHTANLNQLQVKGPILVEFEGSLPQSVWMTNNSVEYDLAFLSANKSVLSINRLKRNRGLPLHKKSVLVSYKPTKYALIAPKGWLKRNQLIQGKVVDTTTGSDYN